MHKIRALVRQCQNFARLAEICRSKKICTTFVENKRIMNKEHTIYIYPDVNSYYQNESGMCDGFDDDVIESYNESHSLEFRIILPGISEWCNRYQKATDFADCKTSASFNWKEWHLDGLLPFYHCPNNTYPLVRHK